MRHPLTVCLLLAATFMPAVAGAGKLSKARSEVRRSSSSSSRSESSSSNSSTKSSEKKSKKNNSGGKLAKARSETRSEVRSERHDSHSSAGHSFTGRHDRPRASRGHHPRRPHTQDWFGFSLSRRHHCPPPVPPVVVTHVYPETTPPVYLAPAPVVVETPVCEPVEGPLYPPAAPSPAQSFGESFASYPYANSATGCLLSARAGKPWLGRVQFELGDGSEEVERTGVAFLLEGSFGFGVDFDWDSLTESLPEGGHDELHIGELNVMYRLIETDHALIRAGIGVQWMGDRFDTDSGVNFSLQADLFPRRPYVVSGELDFGTIGDAQTIHAAATAGVMLGRAELYGGYDYRRISDVEIKGPMIGLRLWY